MCAGGGWPIYLSVADFSPYGRAKVSEIEFARNFSLKTSTSDVDLIRFTETPLESSSLMVNLGSKPKMLRPNDVFIPGKLPLLKTNVYAPRTRESIQARFEKILRRGHVPIVFGEFGVGKTSMARFVVRKDEERNALVYIGSIAGKTLSDIFKQCLEKLGYSVETKRSKTSTNSTSYEHSGQAKAGLGFINILTAIKRNKMEGVSEVIEEELVVTSPTDSKLVELCEKAGLVLVIDELHRASEDFSRDLADFIKSYGNANCLNFKLVLLGTSSEANKLVHIDPGIDRLVQEVHLRAMDESESRYVVREGMKSLGIQCDAQVEDKLVDLCVGSPNILQFLCLEASEAAFSRNPRSVSLGDVEEALKEYVEIREARLYRTYMTAIETVGAKRYRKQILRAMAECEDEYVTMEVLRDRVSTYLGESTPSSALSGALRDLKETRFGPVLKDVERPDKSGRISNFTVFVDPSLKAFIRLLVAREVSK